MNVLEAETVETETTTQTRTDESLQFRATKPEDGLAVWQLVKASGTLEPNTAYFYLIFCSDFSKTCLIAEHKGEPVGVVIGFHPPEEPDTAFCWQIGVHPDWRGRGIGTRLLNQWLELPANRNVRWMTATVATDNPASQRLFQRFADREDVPCAVHPHFTTDLLEPGNAPEPLYRVGPLTP